MVIKNTLIKIWWLTWRNDFQHNNTQLNDTQVNDTKNKNTHHMEHNIGALSIVIIRQL
jgi:hypothetical protein